MQQLFISTLVVLLLATTVSAQEITRLSANGPNSAAEVLLGDAPIAVLDAGTVIFSGIDADHGAELWVSDGTPDGTRLLVDLEPGGASSAPHDFIAAGGQVYFLATTSADGREIFVTDGTAEGTRMLIDRYPGPESSLMDLQNWATQYAAPLGDDRLVFLARAPETDFEPYVTDGTADGTQLLRDINRLPEGLPPNFERGSFATGFTAFGDELYFQAQGYRFDAELWATDGTPEGTRLVYAREGENARSQPSDLVVYRDSLYFYAGSQGGPAGLYRTDGTQAGTDTVYLFAPEEEFGPMTLRAESSVLKVGGKLVFPVRTPTEGADLWAYDGATGSITILDVAEREDRPWVPQHFVSFSEDLLFYKDATAEAGIELWRTDGTPEGTRIAVDLNPGPTNSISLFNDLRPYQGRLYYAAHVDAEIGTELYAYDPSADAAVLVADIEPGFVGSNPANLTNVGDELYFTATSNSFGVGLYKIAFRSTPAHDPSRSFAAAGIRVYPNPVSPGQQLTVQADGQPISSYCRYGLDGRLLERVDFSVPRHGFRLITQDGRPFVLRTVSAGGISASGLILARGR